MTRWEIAIEYFVEVYQIKAFKRKKNGVKHTGIATKLLFLDSYDKKDLYDIGTKAKCSF